MKAIINLFVIAVLTCFVNTSVIAQDNTPTTYSLLSYMKVAPGMHQEYLNLEKAWKKIHQAQVKAGKMRAWVLDRVEFAGASSEYNYITRQSFQGEAQLAAHMEASGMPDGWKSLLTPEEIALVERTSEIRTWVKSEVWATSERVLADDYKNAKVHVFNFFDFPEGKTRADHVKVEKDIWMPVHKARVNAGTLKGWVLLQMELPYGAAMPYHDATVDIFENMEQMLAPFADDSFSKIHPGKNIDDLMKQTRAASTLLRAEVRVQLDRTE